MSLKGGLKDWLLCKGGAPLPKESRINVYVQGIESL